MTEVERAEQNVRGPRRRFAVNVVLVVALVLALAALFVVLHEQQRRTESAELSALSLAEQVQNACESQGSLDLDGRDLCQQADDVVEDPGVASVPTAGRDGVDGTDGRDGEDGTDGKDGATGKPGKDGRPGAPGTDGEPGTDGANGSDGTDGIDGTPGRGIQSMQCATGGWIVTYTDGIASPSGLCRGPQGEPGADGKDGKDGKDGVAGTAKPGTYACPDGEYVTGFTVAADGAVALSCRPPSPLPATERT